MVPRPQLARTSYHQYPLLLEEREHAYADCWAKNKEAMALLSVLWTAQPSHVWGLE